MPFFGHVLARGPWPWLLLTAVGSPLRTTDMGTYSSFADDSWLGGCWA